ncbi:hypothetical protein GGF43_005209 [Coemansia sp. RSA 2618]|nr:hypothetical protein GGF43_005209 [Coemansia sp. RSA 2618]
MHFSTPLLTTTTVVVASLFGHALGEDLLKAAATATDIKSLESAMSSDWASVYYQVNQNIQSLYYLGSSGEYDKATSLYGTTAIPASYVPTWPAAYQSRAKELLRQSDESSRSDEEKSDGESDIESSEDEESSETSDAKSGAQTLCHVAVLTGAVAVGAFVCLI